ncbi:FliH/SctL family protein [Alphaproteobacteria bacterium]|nr:FliH/SctL family protein [Alphaproteobacteria bacterium]
MIDAVKMDVEEQSGHLAESEVARLLAVLQNAEFKRSETRNITKDHSFKPRSLMKIAIEAQQRDAEIEAVKQAEEALAAAQRAAPASASKTQAGENQNSDDPDFADSDLADPELDHQGTALGKDNDGALMPAGSTEDASWQTASPDSPPSLISDAAPNVAPDMTQDMGSGDQSSDAAGNPANDALTNEAAEHELIADNGDGDAAEGTPLAANFETVTAAFERGKAEGMIAGRDAGIVETKAAAEASAQAYLADKIAAFDAALVALTKPQALQAEDLSRSIHAAILKLASQRAGQQIDDMPENFLARIEALVTSIGQKMTAGKVHINADDYKVMLPYLADTHFDFVAEPGLARGDVILKFAGVELHDIAETRLGGQYAETAQTMAKAPADLAPGITPDEITPTEQAPVETAPVETAPVETAPVETAPVDGVAASDSAASDDVHDDQPPSPPDETSS